MAKSYRTLVRRGFVSALDISGKSSAYPRVVVMASSRRDDAKALLHDSQKIAGDVKRVQKRLGY